MVRVSIPFASHRIADRWEQTQSPASLIHERSDITYKAYKSPYGPRYPTIATGNEQC